MENNDIDLETADNTEDVAEKKNKKIRWKEKTKKQKINLILNILGPVLMIFAFVICFRTGMIFKEILYYQNEASDFEYVQMLLDKSYNYSDYDKDAALNRATNSYLSSIGDKYARYESPTQYEQTEMSSNGERVAMGIMFDVIGDQLYVSSLTEGTPAEKSGLKIGDKLIYLKDTEINNYTDYILFFTNKSFDVGEDVLIKVERNGEILEFTIKTEKIVTKLCTSETFDNILYIKLNTFSEKSYEELKDVIDAITSEHKGIVLDLRDNRGGSLDSLEKIAGFFMEDKLIAEFRYKDLTDKCKTKKTGTYTDLPLVVLANENSASASECLIGALKCHNRATIVGTKTFGKGIGQSTFLCPNGGYVTFTTSKYYLPNGECIHEIGIEPDVLVNLPEDVISGETKLTKENDTQLQKALGLLKKKI